MSVPKMNTDFDTDFPVETKKSDSQKRFDNRFETNSIPFVKRQEVDYETRRRGKTFERKSFVHKAPQTRLDVPKLWVSGDPERTHLEYLTSRGEGKAPHDKPNGKPGIIHFKLKKDPVACFAKLKEVAYAIMFKNEEYYCGTLPNVPNTIHCPRGFKCFKLWNRVACTYKVGDGDHRPCHHTKAEYLFVELTMTLLEHIDAKPVVVESKSDMDSLMINWDLDPKFGTIDIPRESFKWSPNYVVKGILHSDRTFDDKPDDIKQACIAACKQHDNTLPVKLSGLLLNYILGCGGLSRIQSDKLSMGTPMCGVGADNDHEAVCLPSLMAGKAACHLRHTNAQEILTQILMMVIRFDITVKPVAKPVVKDEFKTSRGKKQQIYDRKTKTRVARGVAVVPPPPAAAKTAPVVATAAATTSNSFNAIAS